AVEQGGDVDVAEIGFDELEPRRLPQRGDIRFLRLAVVVRGERVDADDIVTASGERVGECRADEARNPSDERAHQLTAMPIPKITIHASPNNWSARSSSTSSSGAEPFP